MSGQRVSHFEILERLGQGGMGVVYKARDLKLDRLVALKFLPVHLDAEEAARQRFAREARTASALDHGNICTIYEIGEAEDGRTFIAMAFCDGETLSQRIARGPVPVEEAVDIASQVARGLAEAHARGIVHRDIKPGNIAITRDGTVKILDFGIATLAGATRMTNTDSTSGTVAYMSPEQARGDPVDQRTDLWSLGVVIFEMLVGRPPFAGEHPQSVIFSILNEDPKAVVRRSSMPDEVRAIVERALSKDPSRRYQTAGELLAEISAISPSESPTVSMRIRSQAEDRWRPDGRRRWPRVALAVAIVLFAVWAVWRFQSRRSSLKTSPSAVSVAVLPFRYRGSDQYRYLGEGMVNLLSAKLDHAGELRTIDPRAVAGLAARESVLDPARGRSIAQRLHARRFVLGSIVEVGGKLQMDAALYDAGGRPDPAVTANAFGDVTKAFDLVDELAIGLLAEEGRKSSARSLRVAAVTTSSLPALKAYLDGESAFQSGDFRASVEAFQKAVALDGDFALAWYRLSIALEWLGTPQELHKQAAEQAYLHADRLTERDRRLLEASRVWREGANQEARRLYSSIVHDHPDEIEGWYQLGEVLFHRNGLYGASLSESRSAFERVLSYEPNHFASLVHLARIEAFEGRLPEMNALVQKFLGLGKESADHTLAIHALQAFANDDTGREREVLAELERSEAPAIAMAFLEVSLYARNLPGAERIARLLTAPSRPPRVRSWGHVALAHLSLARGKWKEARAGLESMAPLDPWASLEYRALFSSFSFLPVSRMELSAIRDGLTALDPGAAPRVNDPAVFIDAHYDLHPLLRMYLMGLVSARMADVPRAQSYAGEIERQQFPPGYKSLAADFAGSVRAQIDRVQNRPAEALKKLEPILAETKNPLESPFVSEAYERFTRAELLYELGRYQEARGGFDHLVESSVFEFVYLPLSHLWLGEICDRQGDSKNAAAHYKAFIDLWRDCDRDLSPMVELARRKLEALAARGGKAPAK
jgi:serine/threonine protein kinase